MKVLHLFSNSKWTGPAEPALNLCLALRALGVEADFACAPGRPEVPNKIVATARARGLEPVLEFRLDKHRHPLFNFLDARALRRFVTPRGYTLVHCHLDNDHRIALGALRGLPVPVVRTSYEGTGFAGRGYRALLRETALLLEPSNGALDHDHRVHGMPRDRMRIVPGAVDTARFDPDRSLPDGRVRLDVPPEAPLFGIVARMQTHRHYEDLFRAFHALRASRPEAHLVVLGRGTHQDDVGHRPVQELGLTGHVHFPGYTEGEEYVGLLRALDAGVFLVPGSDGTCRAVRELMAMRVPVIAADRGMLREIVTDGTDGIVFDGSARGLELALRRLVENAGERRRMAEAARAKALRAYSLEVQAQRVHEFYASLAPCSSA